jgi:hypothetical protein
MSTLKKITLALGLITCVVGLALLGTGASGTVGAILCGVSLVLLFGFTGSGAGAAGG